MGELQPRTKTDIDRTDLSARKFDVDSIPIIDITELNGTERSKSNRHPTHTGSIFPG